MFSTEKVQCDWRALGYEPGMKPDVAVREDARSVLEEHGIVPVRAPHLHSFLDGARIVASVLESVNVGELVEQHGAEVGRSLHLAHRAAFQLAEGECRRQLVFVPGHATKSPTVHSVPEGFKNDDWEDYGLIGPIGQVVRHEVHRNQGAGFMTTSDQVNNDEAFCVIQGARHVVHRAEGLVEDERAEELLRLSIYMVIKIFLSKISREVFEMAVDA